MPEPVENSQRAHPRVEVRVHVDVTSGTQFFTGFSENLSAGGIFIATDDAVPMGTPIEMTFTVPGYDHQFFAVGEVRWSRARSAGGGPAGVGVRFQGMSDEDQDLLYEVLSKVETLFYEEE